jgi:nucleotide-binding universal stress UspA family protein
MITVKKILFPTDFSRCAEQAQAHALYLAQEYGAVLHMLHANTVLEYAPHDLRPYFPNHEEVMAQSRELALRHMATALSAREAAQLRVQQVYQNGISVAPVILTYASEHDIDLIVMGTHGRRGLGHLLLGSVAEEIVRTAMCPVLTIRERKETLPVENFKRILVPIDFSKHSAQALLTAKALAEKYGARLQLLHVVEDLRYPAFYMAERFAYFDIRPEVATRAKQELEQFYRDVQAPHVPADLHVIEGGAAHEIIKFTEKHATDLIVIATHGLTGVEHFLMGSVAEKVVRRAPCPVLTVKTFGKSLL